MKEEGKEGIESDPMFGTSFANVNIERVFLYFHYEFVKRDFG